MSHKNAERIAQFYRAFQEKNAAVMQACYANDAVFNDEVFHNLNAGEVRAMWAMLLKRGRDLSVTFTNIEADDTAGSASWTATYTFSLTGRVVVNHVRASFEFKDGYIVRHTDRFNFYRWAVQAFGATGIVLGWTGFFRKKVRATAMKGLSDFMKT